MRIVEKKTLCALTLAALGIVFPQAGLLAANATSRQAVADVALDGSGILRGQLVNPQGVAISSQELVVLQKGQPVAKAKTNHRGEFQFENLKGGVYVITDGSNAVAARIWTNRMAPPSAKQGVLLVSKELTTRAQLGHHHDLLGGMNMGTLLIAGVAGTIIYTATHDGYRASP
jgi:hypothetical protein